MWGVNHIQGKRLESTMSRIANFFWISHTYASSGSESAHFEGFSIGPQWFPFKPSSFGSGIFEDVLLMDPAFSWRSSLLWGFGLVVLGFAPRFLMRVNGTSARKTSKPFKRNVLREADFRGGWVGAFCGVGLKGPQQDSNPPIGG